MANTEWALSVQIPENHWKRLALRLVGVVIQYDALAVSLDSNKTPESARVHELLRILVDQLRAENDILQAVLRIP